ncbi:chaperone protein dnaJ 11 chloroplastic [Prunus yedoensis var. nudiflora]|uniref:Chaperone protein dnaJ 11 chloroplastic n=1 Tax=Prunus yedoensis var. nudiflora TaxID=2094558 RepID=A0A314ZEM6_PRUYE|nr:chaperone protein dnaJ 11 chloroplastic [Prunus yedoensis var. nudiflora]
MPLPRQRHQLRVSAAGAFTESRPRSKASTSLYEVLRVKDNASQMEIKSAYRSLAKLYHPDASPSRNRMAEISSRFTTPTPRCPIRPPGPCTTCR